jgi:predicted Zn-dependent protease
MIRTVSLILAVFLTACVEVAPPPETTAPASFNADVAARNFIDVIRTVEPVAERECRARAPQANCDFRIVVDDRPGQPANAFQTLDNSGRPVIAFTVALIAQAQNRDELAFVLGHEAGHHILGHLARTQQTAVLGALILGGLASAAGIEDVRTAQNVGASVGARTYSKEFELEADSLGTVISYRAGYDPLRGSAFFDRLPDPGDRFLGSHPPNASRKATVRQTLATLR